MDIQLSKIFDSQEEDSWVFACCEDYVVASRYFDTENLCRLRLISVDADDSIASNRKHQRHAIDNVFYHEWNLTGVTDLSDIIAMDRSNRFVFIAHRDSKSISVFSLGANNNTSTRSRKTVALDSLFKAHISAILPVSIEGVNAVAVVSQNSELAILRIDTTSPSTATTNSFDITTIKTPLSFSGNTTFSSVHLRDSNLLVFTDTSTNAVRLVRIDQRISADDKEASFCAVEFSPILLPPTSTMDPLLGCVVQPKCIFALYTNGLLQAFKSKNEHATSIMEWWQDTTPTSDTIKLGTPTTTNYLKQNAPKNRASKRMCAVGGLSYLGDSYVVAAYGKYISIWDATYLVDHALVDLSESVRRIIPSSNIGTLLCQSQSKAFSLEIEAVGKKNVISLAEAIKRKGTCAKILGTHKITEMTHNTLLEAQPVITSRMKTAANAFAPVGNEYMREMEKIQAKHNKWAAQLTNRNAVADGDALYNIMETLIAVISQNDKRKNTLKRGLYGNKLNLGLSQVPSHKLAAKAIARCLLGIHADKDMSFLKPLIDICGTCAISYHSILAELRPMAAKLDITANNSTFNSISNFLLLPDCTYSIEALLISIPDLPESDIVRFAQFAVRMLQSYVSKSEQIKMQSAREIFRRGQLKMHRLLLRCVVAKTEERKLVDALQGIAIADVKALLGHLVIPVMENFDTRSALNKVVIDELKKGGDYRGSGDWLDRATENITIIYDGCMKWACALIDAHMASLLLDKDPGTQQMLAEMLKHVRAQRKISQDIASVVGSLEHIRDKLPLPNYKKPYTTYNISVRNNKIINK